MTKLGRNDLCFCGSGKKYKKCCLLKGHKPPIPLSELDPAVQVKLRESLEQMRQERAELESHGIYVNIPNTSGYKGKRLMAVGSKLMAAGTEDSTFHELILRHLKSTLGEAWWRKQDSLNAGERHFVRQCFDSWDSSHHNIRQESEAQWSATPSGENQSLLSLAFDIYLVDHNSSLPKDWLRRLRHHDQYQGVRYEIAVASIFARVDCGLEFIDDKKQTRKHPEFIATHKPSGNRVAVEAKSRHRHGVLHQGGNFDASKAIRGDIEQLFSKALEKDAESLPFMVFIDVNAPRDTLEVTTKAKWYKDVQGIMSDYGDPTKENPDPFNLLAVTNYSHHYEGTQIMKPGQQCSIQPIYVRHPLHDGVHGPFSQKIVQAVNGYGFVPNV